MATSRKRKDLERQLVSRLGASWGEDDPVSSGDCEPGGRFGYGSEVSGLCGPRRRCDAGDLARLTGLTTGAITGSDRPAGEVGSGAAESEARRTGGKCSYGCANRRRWRGLRPLRRWAGDGAAGYALFDARTGDDQRLLRRCIEMMRRQTDAVHALEAKLGAKK